MVTNIFRICAGSVNKPIATNGTIVYCSTRVDKVELLIDRLLSAIIPILLLFNSTVLCTTNKLFPVRSPERYIILYRLVIIFSFSNIVWFFSNVFILLL